MKRVVVGVCTCNRNDLLERALRSIQKSIKMTPSSYEVKVVVIDNNDQPSVEHIVNEFKHLAASYIWEDRKGIPYARNRCVDFARNNDADFLVFIDDDEEARPEWLGEMLKAIDGPGVDVVSGLVCQAGHFKRNGHSKDRDRAETDNVIMKRWVFEKFRFDEEMAQTGGTDSLFFRQAYRAGAVIRYCQTAIVDEYMPDERKGLKWNLKRHFRYGIINVTIESKLDERLSCRLFVFARSISVLSLGLVMIPCYFLLKGKGAATESMFRAARGFGGFLGCLKIKYYEYKR